jgi:hypothetical protein
MGKLMVGNDGSVMDIDPRDEPAAVRHGFVDYGSPEHLSAMNVAAPGILPGQTPGQPMSARPNAPGQPAYPTGAVPQELRPGHSTDMYGNPTIEALPGENPTDTIKRAVAHAKTLKPEVRAAQRQREMQNIPKKAAITLGSAATMGLAGPAALAGAGEGAAAAVPAITDALGFTGAPWPTGVAQGLRTAAGATVKAAQSPLGRQILARVGQGLTMAAALELIKKLGL